MWPFSKSIEKKLMTFKKIKVEGVLFKIKKIDPLNYMDGSKALKMAYDVYSKSNIQKKITNADMKRIKEHYRDVFLGAVVLPKLCRKESDDGDGATFVDHVFNDWVLVEKLYEEIMLFTYGKKKLLSLMLPNKN